MAEYPLLCIAPGCRPGETPRRTDRRGWLCAACVGHGRRDLTSIADAWADLEDALHPSGSGHDDQGKQGNGRIESALPLNVAASDAKAQATAHIWFMVRVLDEDYCDRSRILALPRDQTIPGIARWLADWRIEEFARLAGDSDRMALEVFADLAAAWRAVRSAAYPTGGRTVQTGLPCEQHGVTDTGERVRCTGLMTAWIQPLMNHRPDLVCTEDKGHRLTPDVWERAGWKRAHRNLDHAASVRLAESVGT